MRNPNALALSRRDPAFRAVMGGHAGVDFGEDEHGWEVNPHMGSESLVGDLLEGDIDGDFGAGPGAGPTPAQALALWKKNQAMRSASRRRVGLLEPNGLSRAKIERYVFALPSNPDPIVVNGLASAWVASGNPKVDFRPQRLLMNPPSRGFLMVSAAEVSNVNAQVGTGEFDAAFFTEQGQGVMQDYPKLTPAQPATITGRYTGLMPAGFTVSPPVSWPMRATFIGPATMAGGSC